MVVPSCRVDDMNFPALATWSFARLILPWLLSAVARADDAFKWTPVEIGGRDYLSAVEIGRFYEMVVRPREDGRLVLENQRITVRMEVGSSVCTMNGLRFILETPVVESDAAAFVSRTDLGRVLDPVLRPKMIKNGGDFTTVILDPVAGGSSPAEGESDEAPDFSLVVAVHAAKELESRGIKVVLTREEGSGMTEGKGLERAMAVKEKAVFIRIGFISAEGEERGLRTAPLASPEGLPASGEGFGHASMALATAIHGSVVGGLRKHGADRGIKSLQDGGLGKIPHPVVLLTAGNLKHPDDAKLLASDGFRKVLANGIVQGVRKYRGAVSGQP